MLQTVYCVNVYILMPCTGFIYLLKFVYTHFVIHIHRGKTQRVKYSTGPMSECMFYRC